MGIKNHAEGSQDLANFCLFCIRMQNTIDSKLKPAMERVSRYGQEHLLRFQNELSPSNLNILLDQILSIDFENVAGLYRDLVVGKTELAVSTGLVKPLGAKAWNTFNLADQTRMTESGMQALREGKAATFLVAGGQGTRLGHNGPKGTFDIGLPSGKSLFQLQAERLLKLSRDCGPFDSAQGPRQSNHIPWYIMTSRENHSETTAFFESHHFFGLDPKQVCFFQQGELPVVDANGKILLAEKGNISLGPNGNGGCFLALHSSGALEDMKRRGVEWIFTYSVDNALVRVCDPNFLGFAIASNLPAASKAVAKTNPAERVGVFCLRDERPSVLEYSEMTPEMCEQRNASGNLLYGSANIAIHLFRRDFLEANSDSSLPYHVAHKKIPHVNDKGETISPATPNAYKFELFMFDLFPKAPDMAVLEVLREEEFAPVKNPHTDSTDSPKTARRFILDLHRHWAESTGLSTAELNGLDVEVSPLTSYAGEGLTKSSFHRDPSRPVLWA